MYTTCCSTAGSRCPGSSGSQRHVTLSPDPRRSVVAARLSHTVIQWTILLPDCWAPLSATGLINDPHKPARLHGAVVDKDCASWTPHNHQDAEHSPLPTNLAGQVCCLQTLLCTAGGARRNSSARSWMSRPGLTGCCLVQQGRPQLGSVLARTARSSLSFLRGGRSRCNLWAWRLCDVATQPAPGVGHPGSMQASDCLPPTHTRL